PRPHALHRSRRRVREGARALRRDGGAGERRARPAAAATELVGPELRERDGIRRQREHVLPAAVAKRDQQHLVDVELAAGPAARRAVERDSAVSVRDRPAEIAGVRAVGEPTRRSEELEDVVPAAIDARDGRRSRHLPDSVVCDHLEERTRVAAATGLEHAADVGLSTYSPSAATATPQPTTY